MKPDFKAISAVLAVVIVLLVVLFLALPGKTKAPAGGETATTTQSQNDMSAKNPATTGSGKNIATVPATPAANATAVDPYFKVDVNGVYMLTGSDPSGRPTYALVPNADHASFKAISKWLEVEAPTQKSGTGATPVGTISVAYYTDASRVYVASAFTTSTATKVAIEVVQSAVPSSFKILEASYPIYAKAGNRILALSVAPSSDPVIGNYAWVPYDMREITDADTLTFVVAKTATADAHDKNKQYRRGVIVGAN